MLYDAHIAVDWSANGSPKRGKDSIWISENGQRGFNPSTRLEASDWIEARIGRALETGERLHFGFDFAFGLTRGAGEALFGEPGWRPFWDYLLHNICDWDDNSNNRFIVGARINSKTDIEGPFWGRPNKRHYEGLEATRCVTGNTPWPHPFPARRHCDDLQSGTQEVWKLAYTGSVGSQMLLGVAELADFRIAYEEGELHIWPFDTRFGEDLSAPILFTEIYPSAKVWNYQRLLETASVVDEAQVMAVSGMCAQADREGRFAEWLEPQEATPDERADAIAEEGWILGL